MPEVKIRVGASLDRSVSVVFASLAEHARKARGQVQTELDKIGKHMGDAVAKGAKAGTRAQKDELKQRTRAERDAAKESERIDRDKQRRYEQMLKEMTRTEKREIAERAREAKRASDAEAREAKRNARERSHYLHKLGTSIGVGHSVRIGAAGGLGLAFGAGREMMGMGGDFARAMGYDFGMEGHLHNAAHMEALATQISHEGYMPTDPRNDSRVTPQQLMKDALSVGKRTGFSGNEAMAGLQAFVGKTGDLATGRDVLEEMAKISKATGSNLEEMVSAAADVSNQLGDVENKGELVRKVMRNVAGEGKLGAVPIRAMASQMAKIAAAASQMEGDRGENIGLFGAIAQESRLRGGSASAQQATTSIGAMMDVFAKSARQDAFKALHIETSGAGGKTRNIEDIIVESLQKTQKAKAADSSVAFGSLFASSQARRATRGFEMIYRETYANTSGNEQQKLAAATKAVRDEFSRLKDVTVEQEELDASFSEAMKTAESESQTFNTALDEVAVQLKDELMPSLVELAPVFLDMAKDGAEFVGWLTKFLGLSKSKAETSKGATQGVLDLLEPKAKAMKAAEAIIKDESIATKGHQSAFTNQDIVKSKFVLGRRRKDFVERDKEIEQAIAFQKNRLGGEKGFDTDVAIDAKRQIASLEGNLKAGKGAISDIDKMVKGLDDAFSHAMETGTMRVVVIDDKSKRPRAPAAKTNGTDGQPAED